MYKPAKHKNAVREHQDGAIEIRATLLVHGDDGEGNEVPKAIQVHILDLEAVIEKISETQGLENVGIGLNAITSLVHSASQQFPDAHKIEITPEKIIGLTPEEEEEEEEEKEEAPKASTGKGKIKLPLPKGDSGLPGYPVKK